MRSFTLLALASPLAVSAASGSGHSTRYWDCCKPSCSWSGKAKVNAPALTCDKKDNPISNTNAVNGCEGGGSAFACTNYSPWAVNDDLAYGFAATKLSGGSESSWCCACYAMTFTSGPVKGKKMIVQSTNTGGDLGDNHFDLMMPGGGVGIFDGCTSQFGKALGGAQYGGISSRSECDSFPELLKDGCHWRFDWFKNADNPDFTFEQVQCPKALLDISGCKRDDDSSFPAFKGDTSASKPQSGKKTSTATQPQKTKEVAPVVQKPSTKPAEKPASTKAAEKPQPQKPAATKPAASKPTQPAATKPKGTKTKGSCPAKTASTAKVSAVAHYYQCGGSKSAYPNGNLPCASGSKCVKQNEYYSQCVPN
ncbi:endoglucanase type K [Fusarium austroafricanum]|uniref:Cellulase n=1 Tax=Fusarium austroafricanum TaxID=2364996 RepID=A0A8H4KG82_9HYPO|nr:endoglucanase type K [Fusarium austroafricanum]